MWAVGTSRHPWREAGPPNHLDDKVDSDQQVVNKDLSLSGLWGAHRGGGAGAVAKGGREREFFMDNLLVRIH